MSKTSRQPDTISATLEGTSYNVVCGDCGLAMGGGVYRIACPDCGGKLAFHYSERAMHKPAELGMQVTSLWKYRSRLPVQDASKIVTLGEGGTPLMRARKDHGVDLYLKNETMNPTGSHKDRALSVAMTKAVEFGFDTCMLYSDGSAALSSAAYAARAGIHNIVIVPQGSPDYRLLPLMAYHSTIVEYIGPAADALDWVHAACQELKLYETTTYRGANPYQSEGPKTIAYEIVDELGHAPGWCLVPVGGGGTMAGIWRGFCDMLDEGRITTLPRMAGVLPEHYNVLQQGLERNITTDHELRDLVNQRSPEESAPPTAQVKLAMAFPPDGIEAIKAIRESHGIFVPVSDARALEAQMRLGSSEGVYAEISAAVSMAALIELRASGTIQPGDTVVALICGSGFRETGELARSLQVTKVQIDRERGMDTLGRLLGPRQVS